MNPASTRQCPAPGCQSQIEHEKVACSKHWFQLPEELRARFRCYFRAYQQTPRQPEATARLRDVVQEARKYLREPAPLPPPRPRPLARPKFPKYESVSSAPSPSTRRSWGQVAREVVTETLRALPETATLEEAKKALFDAYPFCGRHHHPYKVWCAAKQNGLAARFPSVRAQKRAKEQEKLQRIMEKKGLVARPADQVEAQQFALFEIKEEPISDV